jgi:hypothetical protein
VGLAHSSKTRGLDKRTFHLGHSRRQLLANAAIAASRLAAFKFQSVT